MKHFFMLTFYARHIDTITQRENVPNLRHEPICKRFFHKCKMKYPRVKLYITRPQYPEISTWVLNLYNSHASRLGVLFTANNERKKAVNVFVFLL
ncbi:hypothetical protein NADFUDRAFT_70956 [Nadsonia fulvescens var. elongata DSM 6958]|uniref:Uncharacterized protein n=1 Tax=Nadsonia fulvescens var. elongata DSM 6958 TaxID=857566 RepID=A0A1E3PHX6_9ASCO|nr:hypothetical protein NADFUDRAFT_70956 [Nadsonia fulvescens var. elongata DSM 6958]